MLLSTNFFEERRLEVEFGGLCAHLRDPHILGLVLHDDLLKEVIFLHLALLGALLLVVLLLIQISQVDLVTVFIFKSVQRAIGPFL